MRIAVIADIHGNLKALEAVLEDLRQQAPDLVLNLGDCVSGPLQARETCDLLMDLGWPTVRGNHDRIVAEHAPEAMGPSDRHAHAELTPPRRQWLGQLPMRLDLEGGLLAFHATPANDAVYLTEKVTSEGVVSRPLGEVRDLLGETDASLILYGHTHLPRLVQLRRGQLLLNPGSVGLPAYDDFEPIPHVVAVGSPHARYALVDGDDWRGWQVTFRTLPYDWMQASALAAARNRKEWAEALATGNIL